ncbi:putative type VI secretion system effector, partial [Xanthomonas oryzae]|uniref:putative type VI secretion system effector n=1 Tax=Xanthomonas oryzae TaxID=347 RepID=UPI000A988A65
VVQTFPNTTAEVFFRAGDREGMAATGAAAAALGLSGAAAGMVAMSMEEMSEPVSQVSFELDGILVNALLWNWPFKEGDEVKAVVERGLNGEYLGFAVLDPKERVIVLYPHVSAGSTAHWKGVIKKTAIFGGIATSIFYVIASIADYALNKGYFIKIDLLLGCIFSGLILFSWLGYRIGRRFSSFIEMAEPIFISLGWTDVKNINLREITKLKRKPTDPPAMGDSYFRY